MPPELWSEVSDVCEFLVDVLRATISNELGGIDWAEVSERYGSVSASY